MKRSVLLAAIVLTLAAAAAFAMPKYSGADIAPMTGKVLYIESESPNAYYLTSISPDGTDKKRLTPAFNNIMFPRYNEKSGWIGFTNKTKTMQSEVYLLNGTGEKLRKVLSDAAFEDFSPDGKFLLYTSCDGQAGLYVYALERKHSVKISQDLKVTAARYSPDAEWIAVSVLAEDGTNDLYLISTLAQGIIRLTATKGVNESFPVFTNDGKFIVYYTDRYGQNELEYMDVKTKTIQRPRIAGMYPVLSPDNYSVAYQIGSSVCVSNISGLGTKQVGIGRTPFWIK